MTQQQHLAAQESNERNGKDEIVTIAIEVKNEQARLKFLPSKLGRYCIAFENAIYTGWIEMQLPITADIGIFMHCRMVVFFCNRQKVI